MVGELLGMAMNEEINAEKIIELGDRIYGLKRLINLKLEWKPGLQRFPRVMKNRLEGPTEGNTPDLKLQLREWCEYRNYNFDTGYPNKEELERLGLDSYL